MDYIHMKSIVYIDNSPAVVGGCMLPIDTL